MRHVDVTPHPYSPETTAVFGPSLHAPERILYPQTGDIDAIVTEHFARLKEQGSHTVLVDGAFDVPHASHHWYMRLCKLRGAEEYLHAQGVEQPTVDMVRDTLATNAITLAVTVDADHRIATKKGGLAGKGGVVRPIYPWTARAEQVLNYSYVDANGAVRYAVDTATVERDPMHEGTALETSLTLARFLGERGLLDTMIIYDEHQETVDAAIDMGITPVVIPDGVYYSVNPQTGELWHSSTIIKRAQGRDGVGPVLTRPCVDNNGHAIA